MPAKKKRGRVGEAVPLTRRIREAIYRRQSGRAEPTPRQRRRIRHKANRAIREAKD